MRKPGKLWIEKVWAQLTNPRDRLPHQMGLMFMSMSILKKKLSATMSVTMSTFFFSFFIGHHVCHLVGHHVHLHIGQNVHLHVGHHNVVLTLCEVSEMLTQNRNPKV